MGGANVYDSDRGYGTYAWHRLQTLRRPLTLGSLVKLLVQISCLPVQRRNLLEQELAEFTDGNW